MNTPNFFSRLKSGLILTLSLVFLGLLLQLIGCKPPKPPWASIAETMGYKFLTTPNSELAPGWVIRESDQQPFQTNCFTGEPHKGNSFTNYTQSKTVSSSSDLQLSIGKYASAVVNFSNIQTITINVTGLRQDEITNIKPTGNSDCQLQSLSKMENIIGLLSFQTFELTINTKSGVDVKATVGDIQTKLGQIDAGATISKSSDNTLSVSGVNLYIGYRSFAIAPSTKVVEKTVDANSSATFDISLVGGATLTVSYKPSEKNNFVLFCTSPNYLDQNSLNVNIDAGKSQVLNKSDRYFASLFCVSKSNTSAVVRLVEWQAPVGIRAFTSLK